MAQTGNTRHAKDFKRGRDQCRAHLRPSGLKESTLFTHNLSAVVFFTVLSTSIEFERITPGSRISTSVWKRSRRLSKVAVATRAKTET